jgi:hypothetical protein
MNHFVGGSSTAYAAVGTGDFNGDGGSDILYRNAATGEIVGRSGADDEADRLWLTKRSPAHDRIGHTILMGRAGLP